MAVKKFYFSGGFQYLTLFLADSPNAHLQIRTFSGNGFENDYGDGTWESYINNESATKSFVPNFTGNIHTRTLLGLSDIREFRVIDQTNKYTFDLNAFDGLVALSVLYLRSDTSIWTGDIATLSNALTYLYLNSSISTWTGDIATLSNSLTILYLAAPLSTWTYTTKTWSIVPTTITLRPAVGSFTSAMTDQLLIDLSVATTPVFTGKSIDLRGNCGAKTSASDSAVAIITGGGGIVLTN